MELNQNYLKSNKSDYGFYTSNLFHFTPFATHIR